MIINRYGNQTDMLLNILLILPLQRSSGFYTFCINFLLKKEWKKKQHACLQLGETIIHQNMFSGYHFLISGEKKCSQKKRISLHFNIMEIMALDNDFSPKNN